MGGLMVNFHAYIQDPMLLPLAAVILFDGAESREVPSRCICCCFRSRTSLLMWQLPFSATYTLLVLIAIGFALRDKLVQPATRTAAEMLPIAI